MASSDNAKQALAIPELLFHTILTVIDYHNDPSGATRSVFVLGTHSTLAAAKAYTIGSLQQLNFAPDDFEEYAVRPSQGPSTENWNHGDGILVFARAPAGQVFLVGVDTTPNIESVDATPDGELILPGGAVFLHYVLQTTIDYNADRSGSSQTTQVEGSYVHRPDALTAAHRCLDRKQYVEYDERGNAEYFGQWPFDEDVVVHAASDTGQNYYVAVKTVPWASLEQKEKMKKLVVPEAHRRAHSLSTV